MVLKFFLAFLVLFHLVPPLTGYKYSYTTCPENFECINLDSTPPFPNSSENHCGLCMVSCDDSSSAKIKFDRGSDRWFHVVDVIQSNVMKLHDPTFQDLLRGKSCNSFIYDIDLPKWPISYTIVSNITLYKCSKYPDPGPDVADAFRGYKKTEPCKGFQIYYGSQFPNKSLPLGCSAVYLPVRSMDKVSDDKHLFNLLTAEFDLEFHLANERNEVCRLGEGQLESFHTNYCAKAERTNDNSGLAKKNLKLIIGIGIPGLAVLIVLVPLLICYRRNRKRKVVKNALFLLSRNSSEPTIPDVEGGIYFGVPVFTYAELEKVTNNFDVSNELGSGGFGTVYYGKLLDGREVAVKRLYEHNFRRMAQFMNEIEILTRLRHRNLVSLYGCTSRRSRELLLVYEYIPNGTVADHLHGDRAEDKSLTWPVRMNVAIETAGALAYLHASDIIHRDVKTNNILLDNNFQVKVADFGLSRLFPNDVSHVSTAPQGTPGYVDPEYHQCYQLTDKSDVYSFGVVLIELISSMPAVDIRRDRHEINLANLAINRIQRRTFDELIDPSLGYETDPEVMRMTTSVAELAFQCLQLEKEMRPTMDWVLETLKAIQDFKGDYVESANKNNTAAESRGRMVPLSPEVDDAVLLRKKIEFPSSTIPATGHRVSVSTTSI